MAMRRIRNALQREPAMFEWNVYVDGKYVGTVDTKNESEARCAACSVFDLQEESEISVSKR